MPASQPPWSKAIPVWFPIAAAIFGFIAYGARADATLEGHEARIIKVEAGYSDVAARLARVEQMAADTQSTAHRIDRRLDGLGVR